MAEETEETGVVAEPKSGGMMKKLGLAGGALLLVGAGVFAGVTFFGTNAQPENEEVIDVAEPADGPALYTSLHPPLVINFKDLAGEPHYMQITMEVMARDQDVINAVRDNAPVIRNALILLYSGAIYDEVSTRDGKKKMLADGLAEIREVMTELTGEAGVEAVYFTSLVIQ